MLHNCNEKTLELSKNPEETLTGTEKTLRDPKVGTEDTEETLSYPEVTLFIYLHTNYYNL